MKKFDIHFIFIAILTVLVSLMLIGGFYISGSPWASKLAELDSQRLKDFSNIQSRINIYYGNNKRLPNKLDEMDMLTYNTIDAKTKQNYEYNVLGKYEYELCTEFSTEFKDVNYYGSGNYNDKSHAKGHDCIQYVIDDYLRATPTPKPVVMADPNYGMRAVQGAVSEVKPDNNIGTYTLYLNEVTFFDAQNYTRGLIINDLTKISAFSSSGEFSVSDLKVGDKVTVNYNNDSLIIKTILITSR